ncbi:MAG TPA: hypothetical protein VK906_08550 [Egicoccus sp.]|nr:hypothetical protein [Egicoccus sp.]HSK23211.1 hypothetical protein [Egicoccus sp.]
MEEIRRSDEGRPTSTWTARDHVVGVLLGLAFLAALWGKTLVHGELLGDVQRIVRATALWEMFALDVIMGAVVASAVLGARRWPALPSTILAILLYGVLADPFSPLRGWALPDLGPWLPRLTGFVGDNGRWDATEVLLTLGIMLVTTVWAWTRPGREHRVPSVEQTPDQPPADVMDPQPGPLR